MKRIRYLLVLLFTFALPAAAMNVPDLSQNGSIHITVRYDGKPVSGGELTLYRAGDIREDNGDYSFTLTTEFSSSGVSLENVHSSSGAKKLSDYALRKGSRGETKKIGKDGSVDFAELEPGLYLLAQRKAAPGYYKVSPFFVTLPIRQGDDYLYQVDASPKVSPILADPVNPEQPKTGQSGWPIWVFVSSTAALTAVGFIRKSFRNN